MVNLLNFFDNPSGLFALGALIPFIIVYLIRPKPVDKPIPSLMFLLKDNKVSNQRSLFRTFMRNLLFLLQLLVLLGIAFAVAQPFITLPGKGGAEHTVVILDASASMKTNDGTGTRFDEAKSRALSAMSGKVTLIVAEHAPFVLLDRGSKGEAEKILAKLAAHDTPSAIGDAILLAGDYAEEGARAIAFSDFAFNLGTEPIIAAQTLRARGIPVELKSVGSATGNLAFVNLVLDKQITKGYVKNYNNEKKTVKVSYYSGSEKKAEQTKELLPNSLEIFDFQTTQGINKLQIESGDSNAADNVLFTSVPDLKTVNVLLITNIDAEKQGNVKSCAQLNDRLGQLKREKKLNEQYAMVTLLSALSSTKRITCDYTFPPILPDANKLSSYDIIVLYKSNEKEITPVSFRDISNAAKAGAHLIITADRSVLGDNIKPLLPVDAEKIQSINATLAYSRVAITKNVNFESVDAKRIVVAKLKNGSEEIASAAGSPVIARSNLGNGTSFYYGLLEDYSDFHTLPDYVIFWGQLISELTESVDLNEFNFRTGAYVVAGGEKKLLEDIGATQLSSKTVAANLLNEQESDTTNLPQVESEAEKASGYGLAEKHPLRLEYYLIVAAISLLVIEFIYTKMRGEI